MLVADARTGMLVDANPAAVKLLGRPLSEIRCMHQTEVHAAEDLLAGIGSFEARRHRLIKSTAQTQHIPIIALTAHNLSGDVERALRVGIDAYETKPVVYQRLMAKIAEFCTPRGL